MPFIKTRTDKGGGVALLIQDKLKFEPLSIPNETEKETIGITLTIGTQNINIIAYYNPPD